MRAELCCGQRFVHLVGQNLWAALGSLCLLFGDESSLGVNCFSSTGS